MKPWSTFSVNVKLWLHSDMYIWAPFLDPEDIKSLSLGTIWYFSKGTGLPWTGIRLWDTKGPFLRPSCIRTVRAWTQMLISQSVTFSMSVRWNYFLDWCGGLVMVCQNNILDTSGKRVANRSKCSTLSSCFLANIFMTDFKDEAIRRNLWNQNADIPHIYSLATLAYFVLRLPKMPELCSSSLWNLNWTTGYSFLTSRSGITWATVLDMPATGNPPTQTQAALCCLLACNYISRQA